MVSRIRLSKLVSVRRAATAFDLRPGLCHRTASVVPYALTLIEPEYPAVSAVNYCCGDPLRYTGEI